MRYSFNVGFCCTPLSEEKALSFFSLKTGVPGRQALPYCTSRGFVRWGKIEKTLEELVNKGKGVDGKDGILRMILTWYGHEFWVVGERRSIKGKIPGEKSASEEAGTSAGVSEQQALVGPSLQLWPDWELNKLIDQAGLTVLWSVWWPLLVNRNVTGTFAPSQSP